MVDMNGLGIVLEEQAEDGFFRQAPKGDRTDSTNNASSNNSTCNNNGSNIPGSPFEPKNPEILLPPLPDEDDLHECLNSPSSSNHDTTTTDYVGYFDDNSSSNSLMMKSTTGEQEPPQSFFFQNSNGSFSTYELDSPSINLDNTQLFPTISNATSNSTATSYNNNSSTNGTTTNTSPIKRLRSLKQSIRKLSLSKNDPAKLGSYSSQDQSTTENSLVSSPTSIGPPMPGTSTIKPDRPRVSPIQSHGKTLSQDSNGSSNTIDSRLKCTTPTTPPNLSSPIITLSENSMGKDHFQKMEHNYFESVKVESTSDPQETEKVKDKNQLSQINLINYYNHLINERNLINEGFNMTKARLVKSGWCSNEDLNNLTLQKNNQLNQLNGKIDEVNCKIQTQVKSND